MGRTPHLPIPGETVRGSIFCQGPGGKGFNQAVAAHKAGADVTMMTKLGKDALAALSVQRIGTTNAMPTREEIEQFLSQQ